ncbi:hypothetical protein O181_015859 [Austropuccinia psidii MF-1]|uniref:Uncharacterized protein n=1 Tax=Austropuccinia psidii MF-1 TaxID=1389203 RepID=A0A9Q3C0N2_9BASI|nr:hypothetical protein [Austropuccinia psidii MF-1]
MPTIKSTPCGTKLFLPFKLRPLPSIDFTLKPPRDFGPPWLPGHICLSRQPQLCNPQSKFISQPIKSWRKWFLNVPGIKDEIDKWASKIGNNNTEHLSDVSQGEVWKRSSSKSVQKHTLELRLSLFVNWFNPRGNKISGKQVSVGILALNCLNLPPRLQFQHKYTFLAGIITSPNQPNMVTISNVLNPLVEDLLELYEGVKVATLEYTAGQPVIVKVAALIGDIVANHKVSGFMSHSAHHFCSWCEVKHNERTKLQLGPPCKGMTVLEQSRKWKTANSISIQQRVAKQKGIRLSALNWLPYWDPVVNVSLGLMHNWYEGILHHHFRYWWGFDSTHLQRSTMQEDESDSPEDDSDLNEDEMEIDDCDSSSKFDKKNIGYLSEDTKQKLKKRIQDVVVPKGVSHIPLNIGEKGVGRLKASQWRALFGIYIPLVALDVFWDCDDPDNIFLINTGSLICCTEIVGKSSITKNDAIEFEEGYRKYQETSNEIFQDIRVTPNHHYSMHIPDQLLWWGPLMGVLEFGGERLIGVLQRFKTNSKYGIYLKNKNNLAY